ncbi:glycosyltransferase [Hydrogenophaga sp.]|uniref:glycosyltransferase n=1 Tax=Hydrogenophaga sp. TaxID=1904254 RepID=UPI002C129A72|nr:glycosyltransferase [Hydrogenophaga sp.]HMP10020.1 glycosyltransferase [Hydrogenophaga sp.]
MSNSTLAKGNQALKDKDFERALMHYRAALTMHPELAKVIQANINLAERRRLAAVNSQAAEGTNGTASIDIVVPVFNALEDVQRCLQSLERHTDGYRVRVIVVNDGSEHDTTAWLRKWCHARPLFTLIEHPQNAGYTRAVNTGLKASSGDYVITQNSDTIVTPGWLRGMVRCMESDPKIGVVGPLSNAATWQNVPTLRDATGSFAVNDIPDGLDADGMARLVAQASTRSYPRMPFVNGFCFMIRRAVIDAVGYMDEENFPIGYGEENDFCIRTVDAGFELAIADDVFVYHAKSKSFGHERRKELSAQGTTSLNRKHTPKKYSAYIESIKRTDPLSGVRENIRVELVKKKAGPATALPLKIEHLTEKSPTKASTNSIYKTRIENSKGELILGWSVNTKKSDDIFDVEVWLDGHFLMLAKNKESRPDLKKAGLSGGLGGIIFTNPAHYLGDGLHTLSLRLPDGSFSDNLEVEGKRSVPHRLILRDRIPHHPVTIIVPIFNAADDLEICIERLLAHTPAYAKILLINDCSTDPRIIHILSKYESEPAIRILNNPENFGFTRTVNRGIDESGVDDVVLLNSDARVTPRWLEGMLTAAYSAPRIATVTAMSDRAGAFSAPQMGNDNKLPEGVDEITYARAFRRRSLGLYPRVPTGNGFCMFVSRECISNIGSLDAKAFPRGYGEENDFCMRALRAGWSNIIDDRTYVFHDRSKSFGESKTELMKSGRAVVDARYPEYKKAIQVFSNSEKIALARNRARLAMQDCAAGLGKSWVPRVLFVIATQTGGTPQTNRDLMGALSGALEGWVLRCDSKTLWLSRMEEDGAICLVRSCKLQEPVDPLSHNSLDYDKVVSDWLQEFDFDLVHIRHLGWHGLSLPHLARQLGMKVVFSFHDFYAISPTIKMIDDVGIFLGDKFLEGGSVYRESLWHKDALPIPQGNWLAFWRERFQTALVHCDAFVTTAESARRLILDSLPQLPANRFVVIPHGRDFSAFHRFRQKPKLGEPIRILVPGNINEAKGLEIIRALIDHDKSGRLKFYILGKTSNTTQERRFINLGTYERHEFAERVRAVQPHLGIMFSVWDETYCHTLTELWSVGLPAAVFDFPNVADRVRRSGAGWILDQSNISKLYEEIIRIAFDEREYERTEQALADWQAGYGLANSTAQMAAGYLNIYSDVLRERSGNKQALSPYSRKRIGVVCPASADLRQAPGSTHIRIWERTRNAVERNVTYIKLTPAMLIASAREKMLDGAIIQRTAVPQGMVENVIEALTHSNIPYLLEMDDDLLDVPRDKDPHGTYANYAPGLRRQIAAAAAMTVSTPALQEKIKTMHPRVVLLPNRLSDRLWRTAPRTRVMDGAIRVLYMGSATHDDDLALVLPALDAVAQVTPQFRLSLVGVTTRKDLVNGRPWLEVLEIPDKDYVTFTKWLLGQTHRFDFAIVPLRDTSFNARKSELKLLDCGALGLPVVTSDVSVYRTIKAPGIRLVDNVMQAWVHALREQIALGSENRALGEQLRHWVLQERMLENTLPDFDTFVLSLVAGLKS